MTLPSSRNTSYGANQPILSNDLNALQDCVAGAKHPSLTSVLAAAAFQAPTSAGGATFNGDYWTTSGTMILTASLDMLRVGDRITGISATYVVGTGSSVTYQIIERNLTTLATTSVATATDATGTTVETGSISGINYTVQAGCSYILRISATNNTSIVYAGSVTRDRL